MEIIQERSQSIQLLEILNNIIKHYRYSNYILNFPILYLRWKIVSELVECIWLKSKDKREDLHLLPSVKKKTNSENVSTPKVAVLNVEFVLKLRIYRSLKSLICLKWIRRSFPQHCIPSSTTLHSRSLPLVVFFFY